MKEIVDEVERWRARGERVAVATVVATRKSAPRPVGCEVRRLRERRDVRLGLGRLRRERRRRAGARGARSRASRSSLTYGISDDEALGIGLPCGGEIDVFVERLD